MIDKLVAGLRKEIGDNVLLIHNKYLKTLILNFAYIHSKRRKLGMFIFYEKSQFIYPNKVNSPPIRQFPLFSIFWSRDTSRDYN